MLSTGPRHKHTFLPLLFTDFFFKEKTNPSAQKFFAEKLREGQARARLERHVSSIAVTARRAPPCGEKQVTPEKPTRIRPWPTWSKRSSRCKDPHQLAWPQAAIPAGRKTRIHRARRGANPAPRPPLNRAGVPATKRTPRARTLSKKRLQEEGQVRRRRLLRPLCGLSRARTLPSACAASFGGRKTALRRFCRRRPSYDRRGKLTAWPSVGVSGLRLAGQPCAGRAALVTGRRRRRAGSVTTSTLRPAY